VLQSRKQSASRIWHHLSRGATALQLRIGFGVGFGFGFGVGLALGIAVSKSCSPLCFVRGQQLQLKPASNWFFIHRRHSGRCHWQLINIFYNTKAISQPAFAVAIKIAHPN